MPDRLSLKVNRDAVDGPLLRWFRHLLTNIIQRVVIAFRSACLDWPSVNSEIPQRTILGPILFINCINHISADLASTVKY